MDRIIKFDDLKKAVSNAYEHQKNNNEGMPDALVKDMNAGQFGISVRLTDGRKFDLGHTQSVFAIGGGISRTAIEVQLLTQLSAEEIAEKMGRKQHRHCGCKSTPTPQPTNDAPRHIHPMSMRALSLMQPQGDPDGKWDIISNTLINLMGTSPVLDDNLYKSALKAKNDANVVNDLAAQGFELYDDAASTVDLFTKLHSMLATTEQVAIMGATIAADGVNPETKQIVFDGRLAQNVSGFMAAKGPHHSHKQWLETTGTPAVSSYGGGFLAVIPGVGAIAAFSPELNESKIPVKAALAVKEILQTLQLSALASARVIVE